MARWEHFPHGADIGVRGIGDSQASAFAESARALTAVVTELESVAPSSPVEIACDNPDAELLLADWLNAVIYEMATRNMLFSRFDVAIDGSELVATAWGEAIDVARHRPAVEPKGATYTALSVHRDGEGQWIVQCVVDV